MRFGEIAGFDFGWIASSSRTTGNNEGDFFLVAVCNEMTLGLDRVDGIDDAVEIIGQNLLAGFR